MDTTLRDGEQTSGVSFVPNEKLMIARQLLKEVCVDRIEIASARVSDGEADAVRLITDWAFENDILKKIEVLGFVDGHTSVDWIYNAGGRVINLLAKGSRIHCEKQLGKTLEQHISDIKKVVSYADAKGMTTNIYLEDWSNGMKNSPDFVFSMVEALKETSIVHYMLPDTLGVLNPFEVICYVRKMIRKFPDLKFDFHAHNDYDLAVSNVLAAVYSGITGLHTTINGLGERAGNAPLSSVQSILKDHFHAETHIVESKLNTISRLVEAYSNVRVAANQPIVGRNVFTQVAGVHADGDNKHNLYCNALIPERFGREREYALGKNSGRANIRKNLKKLGYKLSEDAMAKVTKRIIQLGDRKEMVTPEELPYIIHDVMKESNQKDRVKLLHYYVTLSKGLKPVASLKIQIDGKTYEATSSGAGQYDAFVTAVRDIYTDILHQQFPNLKDYEVTIPPGGRTQAFVQTVITWEYLGHTFRTVGLDADQTESAIKATIKMLNIIYSEDLSKEKKEEFNKLK